MTEPMLPPPPVFAWSEFTLRPGILAFGGSNTEISEYLGIVFLRRCHSLPVFGCVMCAVMLAGAHPHHSVDDESSSHPVAHGPSLNSPRDMFHERSHGASWWDRSRALSTPHYRIRTDLPRPEARLIAGHLEDVHAMFTDHLGGLRPRSNAMFTALVFQSRTDYERTMHARYGVNAAGTGGMFVDTRDTTLLAFWTESLSPARMRHVMQHEGFHQFASTYFGNDLPMWVNEGLAEYFGSAVSIGGTLIPGQAVRHGTRHIAEALDEGKTISFRRMLTMRQAGWNDAVRAGNPALLYDQALSMVRFLIDGENRRYAPNFDRYLTLLNQAVPADAAFGQAFGDEDDAGGARPELIERFESRWRKFAAKKNAPPLGAAYEQLDFLALGLLELHKAGVHPMTLDSLRTALIDRDFTHVLDRHGHPLLQKPDESMFSLDHGTLELITSRIPASRREQQLNQVNPLPPTIHTSGFKPRDLAVRWIRSSDNTTFRHEIVTRKN